jgi:hypothetical protein
MNLPAELYIIVGETNTTMKYSVGDQFILRATCKWAFLNLESDVYIKKLSDKEYWPMTITKITPDNNYRYLINFSHPNGAISSCAESELERQLIRYNSKLYISPIRVKSRFELIFD